MRKLLIALLPLCLVGCSGGGGGNAVAPPPVGQPPPVNPPPPPPPAANQAPSISAVPDVQVDGNGQKAAAVTVGDDLTGVDNLTIAVGTDNATLLPASAVAVTAAGANRAVAITPTPDEVGIAQVTLTVTDEGGLTAATGFQVEVVTVEKSAAVLVRDMALVDAEGEPSLLNALQIVDDAQDDDFADLIN